MAFLTTQYNWAVARGYLEKGTRDIMWGRSEDGREYFSRAIEMGARMDESFIKRLSFNLSSYEVEFGEQATNEILQKLVPYINCMGEYSHLRWLKGSLSFNRALVAYYNDRFFDVPYHIIQTVVSDPEFIINRGLLSMASRSLVKMAFRGSRVN
jgi:hypothetical protein